MYPSVKEWLLSKNFTIIDNITAVREHVTVKFSDKEILSITAGSIIILSMEDLNNLYSQIKNNIWFP